MVFGMLVSAFCTELVANVEPYEPPQRWDGLKIRITPSSEHNGAWNIDQDESIFAARFATVHWPEYHMSKEQVKEIAKEIARMIVRLYSCTNAQIRVVHVESPEPASTNLVDVIKAALGTKVVTDEIIPVDKKK